MSSSGDDKIIAVAFRRSVLVLLALGCIVLLVLAVLRFPDSPVGEPDDAELIAPQVAKASPSLSPPTVSFVDITASAGIHHKHTNGAYGESLLPEAMGGGVAAFDYNDDNAVDLLFVSGQRWPWRDEPEVGSSLILYRGDGAGGFENVTAALSLETSLYGMGVAVGDYDGDGDVDLFITALGSNRLFRNEGGNRFEDVTSDAGVAGEYGAWSTAAVFFDYDRDGDLDLFVANYVEWSREIDLAADYQLTGIGRAYGPPNQFAGTYSYLYRNDGGRFSDVSATAGVQIDNPATGLPLGKALAVLSEDIDDDGWPDLVIANDTVRNFLFINDQKGGFEEVGVQRGIAFDNTGVATGAMGIDGTLLGQTAEQAIAIGNFGNEMTSLYVLQRDAPVFTDEAIVSGVGPVSRRVVTFGLFFFDYDLDGYPDLLQANGHVEDEISVVEPGQRYAQAPQLFWNCGDDCARRFLPVADDGDMAKPLVGRGASYADIDRDGDLDVVLTQIAGPPRLLRNDQSTDHAWIRIDVRNKLGAPAHDAIVEVVTEERRHRRRVQPTRSYLSQVDTTLNFGLGRDLSGITVIVTWPSGRHEQWSELAVNATHRLVEGAGEQSPAIATMRP